LKPKKKIVFQTKNFNLIKLKDVKIHFKVKISYYT